MKKSEYKEFLFQAFDEEVEGLLFEDRMRLIEKYLTDYQRKADEKRTCPNKGKPWTDDELRIVLRCAPTAENCLRFARALGRSYGAVELVYRWASSTDQHVEETHPVNAHIARVKKIAKEVSWRAG